MTEVSAITQDILDLVRRRDAVGLKKYGTTLDRTDLSHADWLQHMAEELLDAAGYALAAKRVVKEHFALLERGAILAEKAADEIDRLTTWNPIWTAPCDDTMALVYFPDRGVTICDLDHDSDPQWWAERGATHWMPLPEMPK